MSDLRTLYCEIVTQVLERDGVDVLQPLRFTDRRASVPVRVNAGRGWIELDLDRGICSLRGSIVHHASPFELAAVDGGYRVHPSDAVADDGSALPPRAAADRILTTALRAARRA